MNSCFICKESGHWSRNCPQAVCKYCGELGHTVSVCELEQRYKPDVDATVNVPVSRTRTRAVSALSFEEILYDNHICAKSSMKKNVDAFIKAHYMKRGMVDHMAMVDAIIAHNDAICMSDAGHMTVMAYIINKYADVSYEPVKAFLSRVQDSGEFMRLANVVPVRGKHGVHFRKKVGLSAY